MKPGVATLIPMALSLAFILEGGSGSSGLWGQSATTAPIAQPMYSQDADGLAKEFTVFTKAYESADPKIDRYFAILALPDPKSWFARYFASDYIQQLTNENEAALTSYENNLITYLKAFPKGTRFRVFCHGPDEETDSHPGVAKPDQIVPVVKVPVERYTVTFDGDNSSGTRDRTHSVTVVYVEGAYRLAASARWVPPAPR